MSLTPNDKQTIKELLNEFKQDISIDTDRKLNLLEREMKAQRVDLTKRIQTSEDNVKQVMTKLEERLVKGFEQVDKRFELIDKQFALVHKRFDAVHKVLDDLVHAVTVEGNERYSDQEERIKKLENRVHVAT